MAAQNVTDFQVVPSSVPAGHWSPGPTGRKLFLLLPYIALMAVFFFAPLASVIARSFNAGGVLSMTGPFTLDNYITILGSGALRDVIINTVLIAIYTTVGCVLLGFPTAYLISRLQRRSATILLLMVLLPFWVSVLIRLFALTTVLGRNGLINSTTGMMGFAPFDLLFNRFATVIGMVNYLLPYMVIVLYSGMARIDNNLLTAARSLGATPRQAFLQVYMPQIRPVLVSAMTLVFVLSLGFFLVPAVLGGGSSTTVALYIQQQVNIYRWGIASAIGVVLLVISLLGYYITVKLAGPTQLAGAGAAGSKGTAGKEPLTWSLSTAMLWIVSLLSVATLIVPLIVTVITSFGGSRTVRFPPRDLTTKWYSVLLNDSVWLNAIAKSAIVGVATAVIATLIGLMAARAVATIRSPNMRSLAQTIVYAPLVVPVILLAVGMFDIQTRLNMIGTMHGLVLLHAVVAVPFAFAVISSALAGLDPDMENAARSLGATPAQAFRKITMPTIASALIGSLALSFMTSWDEPVIALFQTGFDKTLPVVIFSFLESGVEPTVPAVAALLIAFVAISFAIAAFVKAATGRKS
jgi:putative spermidine/putrescine transport system permease protein